jgi:hypothetical protein
MLGAMIQVAEFIQRCCAGPVTQGLKIISLPVAVPL